MSRGGWFQFLAGAMVSVRLSAAEGSGTGGLAGLWQVTNSTVGMAWIIGTTNVPGAVRIASLVVPNAAGAGLVPVFAVERQGMRSLRRLPPKGQEGQFDPVAFVLPLESEPVAGAASGRWRVVSRKEDGSVHRLSWELAAAGSAVSGRFDPDTDYRFAHITDGALAEGRLEFRVEYIEDRYVVRGECGVEGWSGTWQRPDGSEKGEWKATRAVPEKPVQLPPRVVALWEWRRTAGSRPEVSYGVDGQAPSGTGWCRHDPAVGRVWVP